MYFRATQVLGDRIYRHISRIRYEISFIPHLDLEGDTHPDYPTDLLAFSVVVYLVVRSNVTKTPIPRLFRTVAQDATYYFLVIFTSHLVLMLFLSLANVRISCHHVLSPLYGLLRPF